MELKLVKIKTLQLTFETAFWWNKPDEWKIREDGPRESNEFYFIILNENQDSAIKSQRKRLGNEVFIGHVRGIKFDTI